MSTAQVASIHYAPVQADRTTFGFGTYRIPAVEQGERPYLLEVQDRNQRDQGGYSESGQKNRRKQFVFPHDGHKIARDIVAEWTEGGMGMNPQCRPGIWVVRDQIPVMNENGTPVLSAEGFAEWRPATRDEFDAMWAEDLALAVAADREYGRLKHLEAVVLAEKPAMIKYIQKPMRAASKRYFPDAAYLRDDAMVATKNCQYCQKTVAASTIKCPYCQEVIDVLQYAQLEARKKLAVKEAVAQMSAAEKAA